MFGALAVNNTQEALARNSINSAEFQTRLTLLMNMKEINFIITSQMMEVERKISM
jgi:hypothetical protein